MMTIGGSRPQFLALTIALTFVGIIQAGAAAYEQWWTAPEVFTGMIGGIPVTLQQKRRRAKLRFCYPKYRAAIRHSATSAARSWIASSMAALICSYLTAKNSRLGFTRYAASLS
jgi:hypothetical protein